MHFCMCISDYIYTVCMYSNLYIIPQAQVLCLKYMHKPEGRESMRIVYSDKAKMPVVQVICNTMPV